MNQINLETKSEMDYQNSMHWLEEIKSLREVLAHKTKQVEDLECEASRLKRIIEGLIFAESGWSVSENTRKHV